MASIAFVPEDRIPPEDRTGDDDHIIRVHGVHPRVMRLHYELYVELMRRPGPLTRVQREMVAVVVSATNGCHY